MESHFDINQVLAAYRFNLAYANTLVVDVTPEMMYRSFGDGLENHPGFTLGHLSIAAALTIEYLGGEYNVPEGWDELFRRTGPGDPRRSTENREGLPAKDALLAEFARLHRELEKYINGSPAANWQKAAQWRLSNHYPTLGGLISFMCVTHEAMHLGQVSAWRRAAGLDSALAKM